MWEPDGATRRSAPTLPLVAAALLLLAWIYTRGLLAYPVKWEEPRRCLIAQEMIHRGDYVVPRLLGEPYLNKPPLQNWLLALAAGLEARRVGAATVRLVSLGALLGIGLLLWRLGSSATDGQPDALPALVFLSTGIVLQYGRTGEIDVLFTFFVMAALAAFEMGRRRRAPALQWWVSQGLLAGGVLTKGLAPIFFYPPALWWAWRRRGVERFSWSFFTVGLLTLVALLAAWLVPYSQQSSLLALGERLSDEVGQRTSMRDPLQLLRHLAGYLPVMAGAAAPWSLALIALVRRRCRAALRESLSDPWVGFSAAVAAWGLLVFLFVPGTLGRYLLPVLPCMAVVGAAWIQRAGQGVSRRVTLARALPWMVLAAGWTGYLIVSGPRILAGYSPTDQRWMLAIPLVLGLVAMAVFGRAALQQGAAAGLLGAGLVYGIAYAGLAEARAAQKNLAHARAGHELAGQVENGLPVVCPEGVDRKVEFALAHRLDRPLRSRPPAGGPFYWVLHAGMGGPRSASLVARHGEYALWRIDRP